MTRSPSRIPETLLLPDGSSKIEISAFDPTRVHGWYVLQFSRKTKDGTWKTIRHRYLPEDELDAFVTEQIRQGWRARNDD